MMKFEKHIYVINSEILKNVIIVSKRNKLWYRTLLFGTKAKCEWDDGQPQGTCMVEVWLYEIIN